MNFEGSADIEEGCLVSVSDPLADDGIVELIYGPRANQGVGYRGA